MAETENVTLRDGKPVSRVGARAMYASLRLLEKTPDGTTKLYQLAQYIHQEVPLPEPLEAQLIRWSMMTPDKVIHDIGLAVMRNALVLDTAKPLISPYAA